MLMHLRKGQNVVGVFYGHPGVFVSPSHRSIAIARKEGYTAKMLPGISAEDCLFADLGIDPSIPGCLTYEATDMLIRNKPLNSSSHLILFQVGCVGITDFNFIGFHVYFVIFYPFRYKLTPRIRIPTSSSYLTTSRLSTALIIQLSTTSLLFFLPSSQP